MNRLRKGVKSLSPLSLSTPSLMAISNITFRKETLGIVAHFQIVPAHAGHILDNDCSDLSCLGQPDHLIPARTVKRHPGNAVVDEKCRIGETAVGCVLQKDFLLRRDLSRIYFVYQNAMNRVKNKTSLFHCKKHLERSGSKCFFLLCPSKPHLASLLPTLNLQNLPNRSI